MITSYYQVEFYSEQDQRWVPLFSHEQSESEAIRKARDWLGQTRSRVVRVTLKTEAVWEIGG